MSTQSTASNLFKKAAIQAAIAAMSLEISNMTKRLDNDDTPDTVKAYLTDVQMPRFNQVLTTLQALEAEV